MRKSCCGRPRRRSPLRRLSRLEARRRAALRRLPSAGSHRDRAKRGHAGALLRPRATVVSARRSWTRSPAHRRAQDPSTRGRDPGGHHRHPSVSRWRGYCAARGPRAPATRCQRHPNCQWSSAWWRARVHRSGHAWARDRWTSIGSPLTATRRGVLEVPSLPYPLASPGSGPATRPADRRYPVQAENGQGSPAKLRIRPPRGPRKDRRCPPNPLPWWGAPWAPTCLGPRPGADSNAWGYPVQKPLPEPGC